MPASGGPARAMAPAEGPKAEKVGVVGGGRMGSGIAHAFLVVGAPVTVIESAPERVEAARAAVVRAVRASADRGLLNHPVGQLLERLEVVGEMDRLRPSTIVIEAVPEDAKLKAQVLQAISETVGPEAIIASNTSSMSISDLAASVTEPGRFVGLHFFNPVPASTLVEIVVGDATTEDTVAAAHQWVALLGKTAITVADSPGFASSRLGLVLGLEAIRMVADGVAAAADIDAAMTLGYQHPVGPLQLTDLVGLDVRLGIAEYLAEQLGERFAPPPLLREMVARGELGRKTGRGFYDWDDEGTPTPRENYQ